MSRQTLLGNFEVTLAVGAVHRHLKFVHPAHFFFAGTMYQGSNSGPELIPRYADTTHQVTRCIDN